MIRLVIGLVLWAIAAYGVLMLHQVPGDFTHDLCGPWGCFPPLQALAAMHALWALLLAPLVVWAVSRMPAPKLRSVGWLVLIISLLALGGVVVREYHEWYLRTPVQWRHFFPQRVGYTVATLSDVPLIQGVLAGLVLLLGGSWKRHRVHGVLN